MAHRLQISDSKDVFLNRGDKFFYLADTVWSAFSNTPAGEWDEYLDYRQTQGFNALQISILPILHDTSQTFVGLLPFETFADGRWDFYRPNPVFFERAKRMLGMAVSRGFVPSLVLLWANYVPDTFFSRRDPRHVMPLEAVEPYVQYVTGAFAEFHPVYLISGDTDFGSQQTVDHYRTALETVKISDPEALNSLHLFGEQVLSVQELIDSRLDFYMYQSGHNLQGQHHAYRLAEQFRALPVKRPVVNGEPCYEGHGHGGRYGRFQDFDVRKAFWQSVLSGAKAGFTYGAHGIFSWHAKGAEFTSEEWSKIPFDWRTALRFKGAWDVSYGKWLYEHYGLFELEPANQHLITGYEEIRMAASAGLEKIALYVPYCNRMELRIDISGYDVRMIELAGRNVLVPRVTTNGGRSTLSMHDFNSDALVIAVKRPAEA